MKANPNKPWNYKALSCNPNITWDIVKANPNFPWNYDILCCQNPNITPRIIAAAIEEKYKFSVYNLIHCNIGHKYKWTLEHHTIALRCNKYKNITLKAIIHYLSKYPHSYNAHSILTKSEIFNVDVYDKDIIKKMTEWHSACVIQRQWFKCITDPTHTLCQQRLLKEFDSMNLY